MKCPFCKHENTKVVNSRPSKDERAIRRRRECLACRERFTTYERIEEFHPRVVKKDGRREPFEKKKIIDGILKACEKRPVSMSRIQEFVTELEKGLLDSGDMEVETVVIGEQVMDRLREWDDVAYVRFASVYKQFKDLNEFMEQLQELLGSRSSSEKMGDD